MPKLKIIFSACIIISLANWAFAQQAIIADHTIVASYDKIPARWIDSVKTMLLSFPGASHGAAFMYGLELLAAQDSRFPADVVWEGEGNVPESPVKTHLRVFRPVRNFTNNGWVNNGGEEHFWTSTTARTAMKNHLTYFKTTLTNPISAFSYGWSYEVANGTLSGGWAGEVIVQGASNLTPWDISTTAPCLNDYINAVVEYNSHDSACRTFFLTGPVDGAYFADERGFQAFQKYEAIRSYARAHGGVLLDYADIISWSDAGQQKLVTWGTTSYGYVHSANEGSYSSNGHLTCHIGEAGCLRLGKAIWWMLARIKGWDGVVDNSVSTPVISPAAGSYLDSVRITLTCQTANAVIRYTTDGNDPTESSAQYSASFKLMQSAVVKAKAWAANLNASGTSSASYTITTMGTAATPVLSPVGDTYRDSVVVTVTSSTSNAQIRCTVDGSDPSTTSTLYAGPLTLRQTTTVKARAWATGMNPSAISAAQYVITVTPTTATPVFSPAGGTYFDSLAVTLSCPTSGAVIRYTLNGSDPVLTSDQYSTPLKITRTTVVKAKAWMTGMNPSAIAEASYTIPVTGTLLSMYENSGVGRFDDLYEVEVFSTLGRLVLRSSMKSLDECRRLSSSKLPRGIYIVRISSMRSSILGHENFAHRFFINSLSDK